MEKKILIIEDDQTTAELVCTQLRGAGYEASAVYDGMLGLVHVRKAMPDLIILDLMLPGGGGKAFLKNVKLSLTTRGIPVIILSATKREELKEEVRKMGIRAYVEKPYDVGNLLSVIELAFSEQAGKQSGG